jgi:hypothetical protein
VIRFEVLRILLEPISKPLQLRMLVRSDIQLQPSLLDQAMSHQFSFLLLLGLAVACVSWTVTHEEVFREPREFCKDKSQNCKPFYQRKFFYLFTCEYCFSHYATALILLLTHFQMLYQGWRGFVVSEFALVWIANVYMGAYNRLRLEIKAENLSIAEQTKATDQDGTFHSKTDSDQRRRAS